MNYSFIKDTVFKTVDFNYNGEIEFGAFDGVKVEYDGKKAKISGSTEPQIARGLFLFAMNVSEGKKTVNIEEKPKFKTLGCMLDCSRNAVMKVDVVKKYIDCLVSLGMNMLMLYTEDTYEIEGRPLFGYMRGRYTKAELREIDDYAFSLGVEVIPCIQTLGHLFQYLKWGREGAPDYTGEFITDIKDTDSVLLCEEDATYKFIDDAIKACREAFRSKRIHIGMDEAHDIGMGKYRRKHGEKNRTEIMTVHLNKVVEICEKYGFKPMMWSDMFFRLKTGGYYRYDFHFEKELGESFPDVEVVYWDYYHDDKALYDGMFDRHEELGKTVGFAGGIVTFEGHLVPFDYSYNAMTTAMKSCINHKVDTVINTIWGDDGNECNAFLANPYLPIYSEYCYKGNGCTEEDIEKASEFLTKIKFEDTKAMGRLHDTINEIFVQPRRGFYSDPLYDLGMRATSCPILMKAYKAGYERMDELVAENDKNREWYYYASLVYKLYYIKAELRLNLREAYQNGDRAYLEKALTDVLPRLKALMEEFHTVHKKQWYESYKPFGFEVLSYRYGGLIMRINDTIEALDKYLSGEWSEIPELNEKVLINEEDYAALTPELISPNYHSYT